MTDGVNTAIDPIDRAPPIAFLRFGELYRRGLRLARVCGSPTRRRCDSVPVWAEEHGMALSIRSDMTATALRNPLLLPCSRSPLGARHHRRVLTIRDREQEQDQLSGALAPGRRGGSARFHERAAALAQGAPDRVRGQGVHQ